MAAGKPTVSEPGPCIAIALTTLGNQDLHPAISQWHGVPCFLPKTVAPFNTYVQMLA